MYLELVSLRQYGNGSGRGVHTSLCLCGRYSLYTMHARLILQRTIDIGTRDGEVDLLESAYGTLRHTRDGELPALRLAIALVHLEEIASKETGLVATCTRTDLHLYVLRVLWILGNQCDFDFFFKFWLKSLVSGQFLACHLLHLRVRLVGEDILRLLDAVQTGDVTLAGIHDVAQVLVFLGELHETVLVGDYVGVGDQGRYLLEAGLQTVKFL